MKTSTVALRRLSSCGWRPAAIHTAPARKVRVPHRVPYGNHRRTATKLVPRCALSEDGGGNDDGIGPANSTGGSGDDNSNSDNRLVLLLVAMAAAMASFAPTSKAATTLSSDLESNNSASIGALKRLTREAFGELVAVKDRLTKLEAGSESEDDLVPDPRADVSIRAGRWSRGRGRPAKARSKVELQGQMEGAVHIPWATTGSGRVAVTKELTAAGMHSGPTTFFTLQKLFKEAGHVLYARAALRSNGAVTVTEATYRAELLPQLLAMLSLQGGSLERLAPPLNPFAENAGLTKAVRKGHALQGVSEQGTGGGICLLASPFTVTAASFLQAAADGSSTRVNCVQTGVNYKGKGALHVVATSRATAWGGLEGFPRESRESGESGASSLRYQGLLAPVTGPSGSGGPMTELGVAGALKLAPGIAISGWTSRQLPVPAGSTPPCGASLHALPDSTGHSATVAVAVLPPPPGTNSKQRLVWELSTKVAVSDGVVLVPGMVMVQQGSSRSMSVSMQTSWRF